MADLRIFHRGENSMIPFSAKTQGVCRGRFYCHFRFGSDMFACFCKLIFYQAFYYSTALARKRRKTSPPFILHFQQNSVTLQAQWFTTEVIKRESGENPEQSRCCKLSFDETNTKPLHLVGKAFVLGQRARRPAIVTCRATPPRGLGKHGFHLTLHLC